MGELMYSEENPSHFHFVVHGLVLSNPGIRCKKPASMC